MCVCAQHEASLSASCIWAAQSYFRTACALEQWQSSTLRGAKTARKCGPIPYSQWCKGVGLLNSGFCLLQRWTFRTSRFSPGVVTDIGHVIIQPCWVCLNSTWKRTKPITLKHALTVALVNCLVIVMCFLWHLKGSALSPHHVRGQE